MTFRIDRRSLLLTGTLGIGALAIPGFAVAQSVVTLSGFTHSVASGEPGPGSMLLWTRYVSTSGGPAKLRVEVSESPDFARITAGGEAITGLWRDFTAKITVVGLRPATRYFYRFVAPDGARSPVGRTQTLPDGPAPRFGIAVFSCSNMTYGYFNAYGHAAARDDVDLWLHLGDYFYESKRDAGKPKKGVIETRWPAPDGELLHLADYRLRYASYRSDPDLQALHAAKPMIAQWDDHESANNSWEGGAEAHQPEDGDWNARKEAAIQAYREWMPVSETPWAAYDIGTLATLFRTETRLLARTEQPDLEALFKAPDPVAALKNFRDDAWRDPAATMLGGEQEAWLAQAMRRSVKAGQRWQIACFGTVMGNLNLPETAAGWIKPSLSEKNRNYFLHGIVAGRLGMPFNFDNWGGYPAARARFLKSAQATDAQLLVLCGDSHNGWAFDLAQDGKPAGVEFGGHSVTSRGYENSMAVDPQTVAAGLVAANPELKWCDTSRRGYMALTLTPDSARNDWLFVDTVQARLAKASVGHSAAVTHGHRTMD